MIDGGLCSSCDGLKDYLDVGKRIESKTLVEVCKKITLLKCTEESTESTICRAKASSLIILCVGL